ncbi:hypothetical protein [Embleya sp. NPDC020630]|uniref:hypothetical protein n=1 Tax=Embleya sp. NPDC020630 TaxID=3363979 RepID=UPI0037A11BE5
MYDFDLEDWTPADDRVAKAIEDLWFHAPDLHPVAAQIAPDGNEQFLALGDLATPWSPDGYPWLRVVHIARDPWTATVHVEHARAATLALAEGWLLERGADPDRLVRDADQLAPADTVTREIERRTRDAGNRLRLLAHSGAYDTDQDVETWVLMHDDAPVHAELPFVVQIERILREPWAYAVREECFPDRDTAEQWITTREGSRSQPSAADSSGRTQAAAHSRTATPSCPGPTGPTVAHLAQRPGTSPTTGPGR